MAGNVTRSEANQSFFIYVKDTNTGVVKRVAIPGDVQVGLEGRPAELQLFGRLSVSSTTVAVDSTNKGVINVSNDDTVVALSLSVTPISGRIKAYLPPTPRAGQLHFIKDSSGTAGTVPIDIVPASGVFIDDQPSQTLSDAYGSLALVWLGGQWRRLVAGLGSSGGSGAPSDASYVTINAEPGLSNERHLTGSTNLVMTDNGPNASVYFDLTPVLGGGAGTFTSPTLTVDTWGRITSITAGTSGAPSNASYITVANEPSLTQERALSGSFGIKLVDHGANSNIVASFDPTLLIAGGNLLISASGGNLTLSDFDPWVDLGNKIYTTSSVSIDPTGHVATNYGNNIFFYVKGSPRTNTSVAVMGGDAVVSGTLTVGTGSNTAFQLFVAAANQQSVGVSAPGAGAVGAAIQLIAADRINWEILATGDTATQGARKLNFRNLTGFSTASFIDAITIIQQGFVGILNTSPAHALDVGGDVGVSANVFATGSVFSVGGFTGSLTKTIAGLSYLVGAGSVTVTSQSNGQIVISGSGGGGGGSSGVLVENQGTLLSASPFTTLNFVGAGVSAASAGAGVATITVPGASGSGGGGTAFGAYSGFTSASVWWSVTGTWTPFTGALIDAPFVDSVQTNITRSGSNFTFLQSGYYRFTADFNAYGSDAYVSLRLSGTNNTNVPLSRTTYRTNPSDQSPLLLDGIFQANANDVYQLQYVTSGTTYAWTGSNPLPGGAGNMRTGEINVILLQSSSGQVTTGSALMRRESLTMLAAMVTTPLASASKANLGIAYFDPSVINKGIGTVKYFFRAIFGPVLNVGSAYVDLYDYGGIVTGFPAPVAGSVLTASLTQLNRLSVDLTSVFASVTGSGILLARAWSDPSGSNYCNAGSAALELEWQ